MAKDMADVVRDTVNDVVRDAAKNLKLDGGKRKPSKGALSGMGGVAAGAGLAALAPLAAKRAGQAARRRLTGGAAKGATPNGKGPLGGVKRAVDAAENVGDAAKKAGEVGEKASKVSDTVSKLPFVGGGGGGGGGNGGGQEGVGKGRRMPVQQSMDVGVPLETCYNQWTQFAEWPTFMHRVTGVSQEDPCTVSFTAKIWGQSRDFKADIETQRPDERIKWKVTEGISHSGVVTFHELGPRLTRVELNLDVDPGSLLEKAARGMRNVKRAVRADMHRFKAYIEMQEQETGAWRGVIEDGELVEDHDPSYDEEREYSDADAARGEEEPEDEAQSEDEDEDEGEEEQEERKPARRPAQAKRSQSRSSRSSQRRGDDGRSPSARKGGQRRQPARRSGS